MADSPSSATVPRGSRRLRSFVVMLPFVLACARATGPGPASAPAAVATVPEELRGFRLRAIEPVDGAPAESLYRFNPPDSSRATVTVFFYDVPANAPDSARSPEAWIAFEGRGFEQVLNMLKERGRYEAVAGALAVAHDVERDGARVPGFMSVIPTRTRGRVVVEMMFLYVLDRHIMKVRASVPESEWRTLPVRPFADDLAWAVRRKP